MKAKRLSNPNNKILLAGIVLFYTGLLFIPAYEASFIPFIIFFIFSLLYFKDIKKAIFISVIISLPYRFGMALIRSEGEYLYQVSYFEVFLIILTVLSSEEYKSYRFSFADIFLLLFLFWGLVSSFYHGQNFSFYMLGGVFRLVLSVLFYFVSQLYVRDERVKKTVILLIYSFAIFESLVALFQFYRNSPLGIFIEEGIRKYPSGRFDDYYPSVIRSFGTFTEAGQLARFLTMLLSIMMMNQRSIVFIPVFLRIIIILITVVAILVSLTRFSWLFALLVIITVLVYKRKSYFKSIKLLSLKRKFYIILSIIVFIIYSSFVFFPRARLRIITIGQSFNSGHPLDIRIKLAREAINLMMKYPIFGVGARQFVSSAQKENVTGIVSFYPAEVHNIFLLVGSEMGLPALNLFLGFVMFCFAQYYLKRQKIKREENHQHLDAFALAGVVFLMESMIAPTFWSSYFHLFLLFMAIISA